MADVVVGLSLGHTDVHRQDGLRTLERLDLRLFIHRKYNRVLRRVDVETDDIADLLDELRVVRDLETSDNVRLEPKGLPDPANGRVTHARSLGHRTGAPVRATFRFRLESLDDDLLDVLVGELPRSSRTRFIQEPLEPPFDEAVAPLSDGLVRHAQLLRNCEVAGVILGARKDELRSLGESSVGP